jgi:hypothetical protein
MTRETKELIKKSYGKSNYEWTWKDDLKSIDWADVMAYITMTAGGLLSLSAIILIITMLF